MDKKVTVIGAGHVGATAAQLIALNDLADVALIDILADLAKGKALDMMESAPVLGFSSKIEGGGDYELAKGSDIVVITAGRPRSPGMSRDELLDINRKIVEEVVEKSVEVAPDAILIVVTNPLDAMCEVARRKSGFPRNRVIGMAGVLDSARMRFFIAEHLNTSPYDVDTFVMGPHGDLMVPMVSYTTVNGIPITQLVSESKLKEIVERTKFGGAEIVKLYKKGSAYYAPAASVFAMVKSILLDSKRILPCSVYLQGEYGYKDIYLGVPAVLGSEGMERVVEVPLSSEEKMMLEKAAESARSLIKGLYQ